MLAPLLHAGNAVGNIATLIVLVGLAAFVLATAFVLSRYVR